MSKSMNPETKH